MKRLNLKPHFHFLLILVSVFFATYPPLQTVAQTTWTQADIDELRAEIEATYEIAFAFPEEWQAQSTDEIPLLMNYLLTIRESLAQTANTLWMLNGSPNDLSPSEHFCFYLSQAHIQIDRVINIGGGYGGNTMPIYENGRVVSYLIQLAPQGIGQPYTLAHEIGHVIDGLLDDYPQNQHRAILGGAWTTNYWIPGAGYLGNENMFPRALSGPNEDFADTFGQMMIGNLSLWGSTTPRWLFMVEQVPSWLNLLEGRRAIQTVLNPTEPS